MPHLPLLILCFSPERMPGVSMTLMLSSTGLGSWAHTNLHGWEETCGEPLFCPCLPLRHPRFGPIPTSPALGRGSDAQPPFHADSQPQVRAAPTVDQDLYLEEAPGGILRGLCLWPLLAGTQGCPALDPCPPPGAQSGRIVEVCTRTTMIWVPWDQHPQEVK